VKKVQILNSSNYHQDILNDHYHNNSPNKALEASHMKDLSKTARLDNNSEVKRDIYQYLKQERRKIQGSTSTHGY